MGRRAREQVSLLQPVLRGAEFLFLAFRSDGSQSGGAARWRAISWSEWISIGGEEEEGEGGGEGEESVLVVVLLSSRAARGCRGKWCARDYGFEVGEGGWRVVVGGM
ncbi:hypothetical protein KC19_2G067400, partial [Ceratodon purpureus]